MPALYTSNAKPDTLKADTYIVYMMMGDYFKSCKCDNSRFEKKLLLNYKDFSFNKQYTREEKIINKIEALGDNFLNSLSDIDVNARIKIEENDATVLFYTDDMKVIVKAVIDKKGTVTFTA